MIKKIKKRDDSVVKFDKSKIVKAITAANSEVEEISDHKVIEELADSVVETMRSELRGNQIPTVERLQDIVEKILIESEYSKVAKAYILYRQKRSDIRRTKKLLGVEDDLKLPINAITVLKSRYLRKDENGNVTETPRELFLRVAKTIAGVEKKYGKSTAEVRELEQKFFDLMKDFYFLPNSPTLMNAGTGTKLNLSACFVIPVDDSIEGIFESIKQMAIIQQSGGGTGFSFSRLRPSGDIVKSTSGVASGPISFMKAFDSATEIIKQGGKRRGANMGILRVDHPDILDFIVAKETEGILKNFNISVAITDKFMRAVINDRDYDLVSPRSGRSVKKLKARAVWNLIITMAWKNGEPGVIFIDTINKTNPTVHVEEIESTNPCGEQPLGPYESCNLGSINLSRFVVNGGKMDWEKLRETVGLAVRFLDNVIDANTYPLKELRDKTNANRRIGLGVMGFADMLIKLGVPYNSEEGIKMGEKVMKFIQDEGHAVSQKLGKEKGSFLNFKGSLWYKKGYKHMRNATVTTIAPTGTIGVIAGCSQGVEPLFALSYVRNVQDSIGHNLIEVNSVFENMAIREGIYTEELMKNLSVSNSIQGFKEIPKKMKKVFVTAHDITPEWHVRMQAGFQKYTDNAVSKTINFPNHATPHDIETAYFTAYKLKCKGLTVYRDGSRQIQILTTGSTKKESCEPC